MDNLWVFHTIFVGTIDEPLLPQKREKFGLVELHSVAEGAERGVFVAEFGVEITHQNEWVAREIFHTVIIACPPKNVNAL